MAQIFLGSGAETLQLPVVVGGLDVGFLFLLLHFASGIDALAPLDKKDSEQIKIEDLIWGVIKKGKESEYITIQAGQGNTIQGFSFSYQDDKSMDNMDEELLRTFFDREVYKVIEKDYSNTDSVEEFINCHFSLDAKEFGTDRYHFISFRMIEILLNSVMAGNRVKKKNGIFKGDLFHFDLSETIVNNISFKGIRSRMPDSVIVNPRANKYIQTEDGDIVKDGKNGDLFMSGDIFLSASDFYRLLDNSKNAYSFVSDLVAHVKGATAGIIDLEQKRENGILDRGNIIVNGIALIDSSQIKDNGSDNYTTFNLHHPREKLQNFSLNTEISDDISNMIFFRSRENIENDDGEGSGDLSELFLFSHQYNLWHFIDKYQEVYGDKIHDGKKRLGLAGDWQYPERRELEERDNVKIHEDGRVTMSGIDSVHNMDVYEVRKELLNKFQRKFDDVNALTQKRILENTDDDTFNGGSFINVGKDYIINALSYIYIYMSQEVEKGKVDYYSKNNFRMPYTISFEVDGMAGIVPSQAFKVDLTNFPVDYGDQESALFVVTGLSHTFEGNSWTTTINGSFWIDFKTSTFLNKYKEKGSGEMLTNEYISMLTAMQITFTEKITDNLNMEKEFLNFLRTMDFKGYMKSDKKVLDFIHPTK